MNTGTNGRMIDSAGGTYLKDNPGTKILLRRNACLRKTRHRRVCTDGVVEGRKAAIGTYSLYGRRQPINHEQRVDDTAVVVVEAKG